MLFHLHVIIVLYHFNVYVCNVIITLISLHDDRCLIKFALETASRDSR